MAHPVEHLIKAAQSEARDRSYRTYLEEQQRRFDLYHGYYRRYILDRLQRVAPNTYEEFHPVWLNILRRIIDRRAGGLYDKVKRTVLDPEGAPLDEDRLAELRPYLDLSSFTAVMDKAARYCELHKTVLVSLVWRHNRVEVDVLPPMEWQVIQGYPDPTRLEDAEAVIINKPARTDTPQKADTDLRLIWTKHPDNPLAADGVPVWLEVDGRDKLVDTAENPYVFETDTGAEWVYPAVLFQLEDPDSELLIPGGDDLTEAALQAAFDLTDIKYIERFQSFGIPVFKNVEPGEASTRVLSPSTGLGLGTDEEFEYVAPPGSVMERLESLRIFLRSLALVHDLPPDEFDDRQASESGIAKRLGAESLNNYRLTLAERMQNLEAEVYRKATAMVAAHTTLDLRGTSLNVVIDPTPELSSTEKNTDNQFLLKHGVISPVELIAERTGLSLEEAEIKYRKNLELKALANPQPGNGLANRVRNIVAATNRTANNAGE